MRPLSELISVDINNIETAYTYMGSVETPGDLWALEKQPKTGEIRFVRTQGLCYVWAGDTWNCLQQNNEPTYRYGIPVQPICKKTEYPDPTLNLNGIWHIIKGWFNYNFVRLGWNAQLA